MFGGSDVTIYKAKGYCRVSTDKQGEEGVSLETQETRIKERCVMKGLNLECIYIDSGLSGKDMNRPQLKKMLSEIKKDDRIIITDLSRLSRNTKDALSMLEQIHEKGAKLVCIKDDMDFSSGVGQLMFTVLMAVHKLERDNISKHVSANMQRLSKEGKLRSRPPFGWRFVGKDKDYEEVLEQQELINIIKDKYIRGGINGKPMQLAKLAKWLNDEDHNKVLTMNKKNSEEIKKFYSQTVKRILIDAGLLDQCPSENRLSTDKRIASHRKESATV